jgi:hypothetical protein
MDLMNEHNSESIDGGTHEYKMRLTLGDNKGGKLFVMDESEGWTISELVINDVGGCQHRIITARGPVGSGPRPSGFILPPEFSEIDGFPVSETVTNE